MSHFKAAKTFNIQPGLRHGALALGLVALACAGEVSDGERPGSSPPDVSGGGQGVGDKGGAGNNPAGSGNVGVSGSAGTGSAGMGSAGTGSASAGSVGSGGAGGGVAGSAGSGSAVAAALNPRIRRLTTLELATSIELLFPGVSVDRSGFVPDARQGSYNAHGGYRRNAAQVVDPVFARQVQELSQEVGQNVAQSPEAFAACAASGERACAEETLAAWLPLAYRRAALPGEVDALLALYDLGAEEGFGEGLALAAQAMLQSPHFLYVTELGAGDNTGVVELTGSEVAAQLSYFLTGGPPDAELRAQSDQLLSAEVRAAQARRLLGTEAAKDQVALMVQEWLSVDGVGRTAKSREAFPDVDFDGVRALMEDETRAFVQEVVYRDEGTITKLLSAQYTVASPELAAFYGLPAPGADGRVDLAGSQRLGILTQGSFLATHATETDSAPVRRGNSVLRQVLCRQTPDPSTVVLNVDVTFPAPDPGATTRERFEHHLSIEECRACHASMDPIGFSFEDFDALGRERSTENGRPVDAAGVLPGHLTEAGEVTFDNSRGLLAAIGGTETAARCFATNAARFATAVSSPQVENAFLTVFDSMNPNDRGNIQEVLVAFAASDLFVQRQATGGAQ